MAEKSKELGDAANKLKNGLEKIDDTREKVGEYSNEYLMLMMDLPKDSLTIDTELQNSRPLCVF